MSSRRSGAREITGCHCSKRVPVYRPVAARGGSGRQWRLVIESIGRYTSSFFLLRAPCVWKLEHASSLLFKDKKNMTTGSRKWTRRSRASSRCVPLLPFLQATRIGDMDTQKALPAWTIFDPRARLITTRCPKRNLHGGSTAFRRTIGDSRLIGIILIIDQTHISSAFSAAP